MNMIVHEDQHVLAGAVVLSMQSLIKEMLNIRDKVVLGISGGRSVLKVFEMLIGSDIPWSQVHIFWIDERLVPRTDKDSNYRQAKEAFIDRLIELNKLPWDNVHPYSEEYRHELGAYGGYDMLLVGVGEDGHLAALFPGHYAFFDDGEGFIKFDRSPKPPSERVTASKRLLENSHVAYAIFLGKDKMSAYQAFMNDKIPVDECPVKILKSIKNLFVVTDLK